MARYSRLDVVKLAESWIGKKESDGSFKSIIDIYNNFFEHESAKPFPRGIKMQYDWAWCACTFSSLGIATGCWDIFPLEISCYYMIEEAKKMGIWVEDDAFIPRVGDAVLYDWGDTGAGDNKGVPDHIGVIVSVGPTSFEVVEGNKNNAVGTRTVSFNSRYIRGFICPKYNESIDTIVDEVMAGLWGNGDVRRQRLEAAGYNYADIQNSVNQRFYGYKTTYEIAIEVIEGKWGNNPERKTAIEKEGYDYAEVQALVNKILSGANYI